jgi:hypothetical protein
MVVAVAKTRLDEPRHEIGRQRDKGWKLVTQLDTGEGVFVRDDDVVGLHIQLPSALYKRLDAEASQRETTKRQMVIAALERLALLAPLVDHAIAQLSHRRDGVKTLPHKRPLWHARAEWRLFRQSLRDAEQYVHARW